MGCIFWFQGSQDYSRSIGNARKNPETYLELHSSNFERRNSYGFNILLVNLSQTAQNHVLRIPINRFLHGVFFFGSTGQGQLISISEKKDLIELENLNSKNDFVKARAETDSKALKKKFSSEDIFKKNLPSGSSCRSLYTITEKIRYEKLGSKMLKGIDKNLRDNLSLIHI